MGAEGRPADLETSSPHEMLRSLRIILGEEFNSSFAFYTAQPVKVLSGHDSDSRYLVGGVSDGEPPVGSSEVQVLPSREGRLRLELPLGEPGNPILIAVGSLTPLARTAADMAIEIARVKKWAQATCDRLSASAFPQARGRRESADSSSAAAWQALLSIEQLLRRVRIHKDAFRYQKRILTQAAEMLRVRAVVWVPQNPAEPVIVGGETRLSSWDCQQLALRLGIHPEVEKVGFLLVHDVRESSLASTNMVIRNLMALALRESGCSGMLIALDRRARPSSRTDLTRALSSDTSLRRADAAVFAPFAALFSLHGSAARRYQDLKDLLVGLTRALTAAIDAKDAYTFGHSERVGRIALELGRELGLQEEEQSDLYLAGLLHDIGKIGIRDEVLCKRGPLTADEYEHLKQHVTIGYNILADLHSIRNLLPGVLYHHERYDGGGYPEGLKGEAIPFLARVLAVADSYDAMSSNRPYRTAMNPDRVEAILVAGGGTQWDQRVIDAFARCKTKLREVCQRGIGESLRDAITGALRREDSSQGVRLRSGLSATT